jgi:hypothetical protein
VTLRSLKAAHIHRLPALLATLAVDVSRGAVTLGVTQYAKREHALIEQVELLRECALRNFRGLLLLRHGRRRRRACQTIPDPLSELCPAGLSAWASAGAEPEASYLYGFSSTLNDFFRYQKITCPSRALHESG